MKAADKIIEVVVQTNQQETKFEVECQKRVSTITNKMNNLFFCMRVWKFFLSQFILCRTQLLQGLCVSKTRKNSFPKYILNAKETNRSHHHSSLKQWNLSIWKYGRKKTFYLSTLSRKWHLYIWYLRRMLISKISAFNEGTKMNNLFALSVENKQFRFIPLHNDEFSVSKGGFKQFKCNPSKRCIRPRQILCLYCLF